MCLTCASWYLAGVILGMVCSLGIDSSRVGGHLRLTPLFSPYGASLVVVLGVFLAWATRVALCEILGSLQHKACGLSWGSSSLQFVPCPKGLYGT